MIFVWDGGMQRAFSVYKSFSFSGNRELDISSFKKKIFCRLFLQIQQRLVFDADDILCLMLLDIEFHGLNVVTAQISVCGWLD